MDDQNRKLHASTWKNWKIVVISFKNHGSGHQNMKNSREQIRNTRKHRFYHKKFVILLQNCCIKCHVQQWRCHNATVKMKMYSTAFLTMWFHNNFVFLWIIIHDAFVMKTSEGWTKILCFRSRTLSMKLCRYTRVELTQDYLVQVTGSTTIDVIIIRRGLCISVRSQTDGSIL